MHFAAKKWLSCLGITNTSGDATYGWVDFEHNFPVRSREEWLQLWLEFEPDDTELATMTREEVWAIWHIRLELRQQTGQFDQLPERWEAIRNSIDYREKYEAGEKSALVEMLAACARTGMRIPEWAAEALSSGVQSVQDYEKGSWDEIFGRPAVKGSHLSAKARRKKAYDAMLQKFRDLQADMSPDEVSTTSWGKIPGVPIDDSFFDNLGREIGVSRTVAKEIYYEHKRYVASMDATFREILKNSGNTDA